MSSSKSSKRKRRLTRLTFADLTHPNFEELSRQFPHSFGVAWQGVRERQRQDGGSFASNVTDEFSRATTRALLHSFFGLSLPHIPSLCPPVPNRYFLVQWIQQTLLSTLPSSDSADHRCGIDIGTGATCIYPLLFCAPHNQILESDNDNASTSSSNTQWTWFASEIDPTSVTMAQKNVVANHLESKIKVIQVQPTTAQQQQEQQHAGPLLQLLQAATPMLSNQKVDIVLTNPPFHDPTAHQVTQPTRQGDHRLKTNLTCTEASYPGGEVAFVTDMLADALTLRYHHRNEAFQSTWYACMLGKKTSFQQLHHLLDYLLGPGSIPSTQFGPGHLTRWFLAWTLQRPTMRSPLAKSTRPSFAVTVSPQDGDYNSGNNSSVPAIVQRIATYFREQRNYSLAIATTQQSPHGVVVSVREETPTPVEWDDKKLPPAVWQVLQKHRIRFLDTRPAEGHFLLDISVDNNNNSTGGGRVQVTAYTHSTWGCKAVETLTNTNKFKAEIGRTSRKWRRIQQQRQQQQQQQQPMDES